MLEELLQNLTFDEERVLSDDITARAPAFSDPNALLEYQKRAAVAILYQKSAQAHALMRTIADSLSAMPSQQQLGFAQVWAWLGIPAMQVMDIAEVEQYLSNAQLAAVFAEYDFCSLSEAIRLRLTDIYDVDERAAFREQLSRILHQNQTVFSARGMSGAARGTIAYWLTEYDQAVGLGSAEAFARATFENKPELQRALSASEQTMLTRLFDFYEWLKLPSNELSGFEEDTIFAFPDKRYVLSDGTLFDITRANTREQAPQSSARAANARPEPALTPAPWPDDTAIAARAKTLLAETGGAVQQIHTVLSQSLATQKKTDALAAMLLLAQLRMFDSLLRDSAAVRGLVESDLKASNLSDRLDGLRINPTSPQFIARFMKIALEDMLGIDTARALAFGQRIARIMQIEQAKYAQIVKQGEWNM